MIIIYALFIALGLFMIAAAVFNWDIWFYDVESHLINIIGGETMVRWYWGIGGAAIIVFVFTDWMWGWWPRWW